jgi:hypothetical protein
MSDQKIGYLVSAPVDLVERDRKYFDFLYERAVEKADQMARGRNLYAGPIAAEYYLTDYAGQRVGGPFDNLDQALWSAKDTYRADLVALKLTAVARDYEQPDGFRRYFGVEASAYRW